MKKPIFMKSILWMLILFGVFFYASAIKAYSIPNMPVKDCISTLRDDEGNKLVAMITDQPNSDTLQLTIFNPPEANGRYGCSVSNAGDVNGDGFDDIIIGAFGYPYNPGKAFIYFGGLILNTTPDIILTDGSVSNHFGYSVSTAGDVNGDGYSDVIVGANRYGSNTGRAYIFFGGSAMDNTADVIMTGEIPSGYFGESVSTAGDVNGDGYSDVIVGNGGYIFLGGPAMDNIPDIILNSVNVSTAGDVNGDGFSDVIVGAGGVMAYIFFGGTAMDDIPDVIITTESMYDFQVSDAGDVNGDGFSDVIIGNPSAGLFSIGKAFIYFGGSSMDNFADVTLSGNLNFEDLGYRVSTAGDVNGDGFSDIILGTFHAKSAIYFGGSSMDDIADFILDDGPAGMPPDMSVSSAGDFDGDGYSEVIVGVGADNYPSGTAHYYDLRNLIEGVEPDLTFTGENTQNYFGASATSAGDVNADGYNDYIIGAPDFDGKHGRSYLYYGGHTPDNIPDVIFNGETSWYPFFGHSSASAGDVNGDGYDDIIIGAYGWAGVKGRAYIFLGGSNMDNDPDIVMEGEQLFNDLGMCVASAGDINEDGYDDVIVNARGYNNWTGRAYVFFGGSNMDNIPDIIFTGENIDDQFSSTVANAGDVNGDHRPDLVITAYRYSNSTGRAYIYYGGAGMDNSADVILTGENVNDQFGANAATAGDINKDGYSDIIIQASEYNNSTGRTYIYYGSSVMDNIPDMILNGESPGNNFGSVTLNQDINGDGYSDLEIGAPGFNNNTGRAYVYLGGTMMDTIPDYIMDGENSGDLFGVRASSAGDINSDGYNDIIVSAFGYNNSMGKAYLYYGSGEPLSECIIAGPTLITTGSPSVVYRSTGLKGFWELSNYGNTQAAIVSENSHDSVLIDAGNIPGHFVLYYSDNNSLLCTKHVYVDNPTPVEFSDFSYVLNGRDVTLSWTTSAEINNSGFEVERSNVKGQLSDEWSKIGFVKGKGNFSTIDNYEFIEKGLNTGKYKYRLKQIDFNGYFEYFELTEEVVIGIPLKYNLSQNYPNPFNPVTNMEFEIPKLGFVTLKIYDVLGRELVTLVNEMKEPGYYKVKFDAGNLSSGVYFYRMTAGDFAAIKKLVVLK